MIWDRLQTMASFFAADARQEAGRMARRWRRAAADEKRLAEDLIGMAGVLTPHAGPEGGLPILRLPDPAHLAYAAGRRDLALQLLALMGLTSYEMNILMKENDDD